MYQLLVLVHVLCAIVAVGYNASYAIWLARGAQQRDQLLFALRGIRYMDSRIANPCYGLLLLTGIALVIVSGRPWHQAWLEWAIVLWVVLAALAYGAYTPALKKQIRLLEASGPDDATYRAVASRQQTIGIALSLIALAIVVLMVFRPGGA